MRFSVLKITIRVESMVLCIYVASLFCLGIASVTPLVRGQLSRTGTEASTCGFVVPCVMISSQRSSARATARMTLSEGTEAPRPPSSGMPDASSSSPSSDIESAVGNPIYRESPPATVTRTPTPRTGLNQPRRAEPPPSIESLQTTNQRRRARPLSQLKRVKPKKRAILEDEGEFRPLIAKTDRESVLRGEDYWIDYRELDAERARKEARARAPPPDQFAQSKMKAEIANPYKQNWILVISIAIAAIATFIKINPDVLSDSATINFPTEL